MSWLSKTVKKISHAVGGPDWLYYPFDVSDDKKSTIGSGAIDPLTGAPELSQMGMFKSMSDFRLRRAMGIGGSRGASRVVNPIGSNPKGAPFAQVYNKMAPQLDVNWLAIQKKAPSNTGNWIAM